MCVLKRIKLGPSTKHICTRDCTIKPIKRARISSTDTISTRTRLYPTTYQQALVQGSIWHAKQHSYKARTWHAKLLHGLIWENKRVALFTLQNLEFLVSRLVHPATSQWMKETRDARRNVMFMSTSSANQTYHVRTVFLLQLDSFASAAISSLVGNGFCNQSKIVITCQLYIQHFKTW